MIPGSPQQRSRSYFRYDVRHIMPPDTFTYYEKLDEIHAFLESLSFGSRDQHREARAAYEQKLEELRVIQTGYRATPKDAEMVFDRVIEEIATVLSTIDLGMSYFTGRLTPGPSYGSIQPDTLSSIREYPDITDCLAWARKALDALAGQDLLYFSWQFRDDTLWLTLH